MAAREPNPTPRPAQGSDVLNILVNEVICRRSMLYIPLLLGTMVSIPYFSI